MEDDLLFEEKEESDFQEYLDYIGTLEAEIKGDIEARKVKQNFFNLIWANCSSATFALTALQLGLNWYTSALIGVAVGASPLLLKFEEMKGKDNNWKDWSQLALQLIVPVGISGRLVHEKKHLEDDLNYIKNPNQLPGITQGILVLSVVILASVGLRLLRLKKEDEWS
jgi:hypothetical protein